MNNAGDKGGGSFPQTQWTQVELAAQDATDGRRALGQLLERYLPALRVHLIRRKGLKPERAEDVLQSFIAQNILERHLLGKANRARGARFRSFLLTALDHFLINEIARERAKKRSSQHPEMDIDTHAEFIASRSTTNEYDVAWAQQVIDQTIERMQAQCLSNGRPDMWELFDRRVLRPILFGEEPLAYQEIIGRLGYASPIQASNVVMNAKRMFQRILRQVIGEYAAGARDVEREIDELMGALSIARAE